MTNPIDISPEAVAAFDKLVSDDGLDHAYLHINDALAMLAALSAECEKLQAENKQAWIFRLAAIEERDALKADVARKDEALKRFLLPECVGSTPSGVPYMRDNEFSRVAIIEGRAALQPAKEPSRE